MSFFKSFMASRIDLCQKNKIEITENCELGNSILTFGSKKVNLDGKDI